MIARNQIFVGFLTILVVVLVGVFISKNEALQAYREFNEQTKKVSGVTYEIGIDESATEAEVIEVMHKMTHQKVKAEDKWGAIPMISDTIDAVSEIIESSNYPHKEDLLEIVKSWKHGDFKQIDEDHNYFWEYQDGTVGKAYGVLNKTEEKTFIVNNFGEEYLPR
ncbi:DUF6241 domain-containing protein [Fredinandcohnia humi]